MKISCKNSTLVESLSNVQRAVSAKSNMPVLEGILITTNENTIQLCGYNMELGIKTTVEAKIEEPGAIIVNARLLTDITRKLPQDTVVMEVDKNLTVKITSGESEFSLIGVEPSEFPELPKVDNPNTIKIQASVLKSMIKQTIFAVAETDSKPIHTGTLFDIRDKKIKLVSVDGYRLAVRSEQIKEDFELRFVVPGKTLNEILKLLPDDEEKTVESLVGMRHITFIIEKYCVISRLLEGEFLDYQSTIPELSSTKIISGTRDLIDSVERVSLMITDRLKSPVRCVMSDNRLRLSCNTSIGKAVDEINVLGIGDSIEIGFNNKYMIDALKNTNTDEVEIQMNGPLSPIKIVPKDGDCFLFLVLPVRLKSE